MKSFILSFCLLFSVAHAAVNLNDLSVTPAAKIATIPDGDLVYLSMTKAVDPYGYFEEGMDMGNENPLSIDKAKKIFSVSIGGSGFANDNKDKYNQQTIQPLAFSKESQRYLVTLKYEHKVTYQILINVDRTKKKAKAFMREWNGKKWDTFSLLATFAD